MAFARITDPETSHQAAASVKNVTEVQELILSLLRSGMTDQDLVIAYNSQLFAPKASESGIRSRRAELVDRGLVKDTGNRVKLVSGRNAIVWKAV